jgi:capsular polysaccharide transport system permease protein
MAAGILSNSLRTQGRVLLALMLREARTRYGRTRGGYLWALIEPVLHISIFYLIYLFRVRMVPLGDNLFVFLMTGFGVYIGFRNVVGRTEGAYASNEALLSFPVVQVLDVFLARALLELATWTGVNFILFGMVIAFFGEPFPPSVFKMLAAVLALFCVGFGLGVCIGIMSEFAPSVGNLMRFPFRILYFLSGVFYLPDTLPPSFRAVLAWNPVVHGITLFREGYYTGYSSHLLDIQYLYGWAIVCVFLAFVAERTTRRPIRNIAR